MFVRSNWGAAFRLPHTIVGRTPASAAGPLAGYSDLVKTSTSRARAPGAGQGTRPTNSIRNRKSMNTKSVETILDAADTECPRHG
jgi:hypothetical protein